MSVSELHKVERKTLIRADRSRVWRALTNVGEFCRWFSCEGAEGRLPVSFNVGARVALVSTHAGDCKGETFYMEIAEITPEELFSWRWHPGAKIPGEELSNEPMTLVEFQLAAAEGGTLVTVVESGFDRLSEARRSRVIAQNEAGWQFQIAALEKYLG